MNYLAHRHLPGVGRLPLALIFTFFLPAIFTLPSPVDAQDVGSETVFMAKAAPVVIEQVLVFRGLPVAADVPVPSPKAILAAVPRDIVAIIPKVIVAVVPADMLVIIPEAIVLPSEARLLIPGIGVDAVIKEMGFTSDGAMAVPANNIDVGWFEPGTRPGLTGSAVIGGHNRWGRTAAVFERLDQLAIGDTLSVVDAKGASISFVVRAMRTFDADDADSGIFESVSGVHLNLITCSGVWDPSTQSYTTRLVVYTDLVS